MADNSPIEWTDATWNPITGCSVVSPGCTNCYAMRLAGTRLKHTPSRAGLTTASKAGPVWNGQVRLNAAQLTQPLRWKRPRRIFVCAHGDLFHESVPDAWIDQVFAVMALSPQHTFQVLTKRAERMRAYLSEHPDVLRDRWFRAVPSGQWPVSVNHAYAATHPHASEEHRKLYQAPAPVFPLPNVWLGVSAEDQTRAADRTPHLLATPAAVRFLSAEPLLGPIDTAALPWRLNGFTGQVVKTVNALTGEVTSHDPVFVTHNLDTPPALDWVIVGGESGSDARPMHPDWARQIRDACAAAGVPFFFKQWGAWAPVSHLSEDQIDKLYHPRPVTRPESSRRCKVASLVLHNDGQRFDDCTARGAFEGGHGAMTMFETGKKAAGRQLDGVTHAAMPGDA